MKTIFTLFIVLLICSCLDISAQENREITGKVTSKQGTPLSGATVLVKGTAIGTYVKADGKYKLTIPTSATTLIIKLLGMKTKEVTIGQSNEINIVLEEDAMKLNEVVVTAVGIEKEKKAVGYAVQEVGGHELTQSREVNIVQSLSAKSAGVQINSSAGVAGASSNIIIRGASSITGDNSPLFVIDGIPIDNSQLASGNPDNGVNNLLSGVAFSNRAIDLNPEDVASATVLKGPAATALYGLRASGGAIIITTKRGSAALGDKINISFNTSVGFEQASQLPGMQKIYSQGTGGQYLDPSTANSLSWGARIDTLKWDQGVNRFDKNGNIVGASNPAGKIPVTPYDNLDNFYTTGTTYTNSLGMSGGSEAGTYYFSFSNLKQYGIVPNNDFTRSTVKIAGDARIASNLKASGSISYMNSGGSRVQQGSNTSGIMLGLLRTPPTFDNSNGNGKGQEAADNESTYQFADNRRQRNYRGGGGYDNPFWTVNKNPFIDDVDRVLGNVQLNYVASEWAEIMYRMGGDFYSDRRDGSFAIGSRTLPAGQVSYDEYYNRDITSDLIVTFNKKINDDWMGTLLLGNNVFSTSSNQLYVQGDGLVVPDFYHISNTQGQISRDIYGSKRTAAFYGDLSIKYKDMLFFGGTLRNEWSTSLPDPLNNSFMYGSGNVNFVFTELMDQSDVFSFGKLRLSYAVVGKDAPIYSTITTYSQGFYSDGWTNGISFPYGGLVGYMEGNTLGSSALKPEKTIALEIGLDLRFFENRLGLDISYYKQNSVDQIFSVPTAATSGFNAVLKNAGEMENKGIEVMLTANPINTGGFNWDTQVNFAKNTNTVIALTDGVENIFLGGFEGASVRAVAGLPYATIFGKGFLRDANGNLVISNDTNDANNGFPMLDPKEKAFGSATPDWTMGFRNTFSYEGITLSVLLDIKKGGVLWNGTRSAMYYFGTSDGTADRGAKKVYSGVTGHLDADGNPVIDGLPNTMEVTLDQDWYSGGRGNGFIGDNTEDFIEDAGWTRLREVTLSYRLPKSIIESTPFSSAEISITGRNLWLSTDYTGVDPETSLLGADNAQGIDYFNMPGTKSYTFALRVNF
ncbi:MAG: SusC/RagA family TonB-linked outer membrane protein [Ignavibacteriae bacterium]|nr:SusC/RagA family TonB-linked outer membrane protein [Ignavibacteriota bacterium]